MKVHGIVNCDTVRHARRWLESHRIDYAFVDFRKTPPSEADLARWSDAAGWETLLNRRGTSWRQLPEATRDTVKGRPEALALMREKPTLIKRPVVESDDGSVVVGFDETTWSARFGGKPARNA